MALSDDVERDHADRHSRMPTAERVRHGMTLRGTTREWPGRDPVRLSVFAYFLLLALGAVGRLADVDGASLRVKAQYRAPEHVESIRSSPWPLSETVGDGFRQLAADRAQPICRHASEL